MSFAPRHIQAPLLLIYCYLLVAQAQKGSEAKIEKQIVSVSPGEELRQAIDELKNLIRAADDIQDNIKKAVVKHASLLRRAEIELTNCASRDTCPNGQCRARHKMQRPAPSKADMWKRPLFALCLGLVGYWQYSRLRGRKRAAALETARGDRDALEHDAALAAFGRERGRIPGEDDEFAAELRNALNEEERHLSSDHFRRSLMENKWRPKRATISKDAPEDYQHTLLKQRMARSVTQQAVPSQQQPTSSEGQHPLASSLARLQQLEDSELRRRSPNKSQLPAAKAESQNRPSHSNPVTNELPGRHMHTEDHEMTAAESKQPPMSEHHAAGGGVISSTGKFVYSTPPEFDLRRALWNIDA